MTLQASRSTTMKCVENRKANKFGTLEYRAARIKDIWTGE